MLSLSYATQKSPKSDSKIKNTKSHNNQSHNNTLQNHDKISYLQQTLGNQEIQRMIKSGIIQPKLKISQPNDPYEREADIVVNESAKLYPSIQQQTRPLLSRQENPNSIPSPDKKEKPTKDKLKDAAKKTGEALLETKLGKSIKKLEKNLYSHLKVLQLRVQQQQASLLHL